MGGGPFVTDASYFTITVQGGKESGGNEIAMRTQFCQIAGTVLQASTRATLAGVTVTLTEAKGSRRILHTNAKGEFSTVLPPGTYRLAAEYEGFVTASAIAPVTAAIGQRSTGIEIVMNMVAGGAAPIPEATPPSGEFALAPDVSVSSGPFMIDPATCPAASSKITGTAFVRYTLTLSPFGASNPKFARFLMTQDFNGSGKDASGNGYVVVGFSSIDFEGERSPSPMTNDTELNGRLTAEVIPAAGSNGRGYKMVQIIKGKLSGPESKPKLPVVMSTHPDGCFPFTKLGG